jgi:aldehyde dehydrogenase (NAD+)
MLKEGRDDLCNALMQDLHKSAFESWATEIMLLENEIHTAMTHLEEWMAPKYTDTSALNWPAGSYTLHDPLGVVLIMGSWNYPVQLTLAPVIGAIAGGNCVVIRPGSYSVATSHAICRLVDKYMDKECIRVAEGDRTLTNKLLEHKFDKIFFTGSEFVGKLIAEAAAKHLTPVCLELGGKSPTIVDRSANLVHAAERIAWATFLNAGQTCVRPDFCMIHEDVADEFFKVLKATLRTFYTGNAKETEFYGRIINKKAFERLSALVTAGKDCIILGGDMDASERYIEPTVFDFGADLEKFQDLPIMQDEIFGPKFPSVR